MMKRVVKSSALDCLEPRGGRGTVSRRVSNRPLLAPIVRSDRDSVVDSSSMSSSKAFRHDRLRKLPNAPLFATESECVGMTIADAAAGTTCSENVPAVTEGGEERDAASDGRRIHFLECSVTFLRKQHAQLLSALHTELESAKRQIQELQFRLVMAEEQNLVRQRRSAFEQNRLEERRIKKEMQASELAASSYCSPSDKLVVSMSPTTGSAWVKLPRSPVQRGVRMCSDKQTGKMADKQQQTKKKPPRK